MVISSHRDDNSNDVNENIKFENKNINFGAVKNIQLRQGSLIAQFYAGCE